jgi:hypothetical protein
MFKESRMMPRVAYAPQDDKGGEAKPAEPVQIDWVAEQEAEAEAKQAIVEKAESEIRSLEKASVLAKKRVKLQAAVAVQEIDVANTPVAKAPKTTDWKLFIQRTAPGIVKKYPQLLDLVPYNNEDYRMINGIVFETIESFIYPDNHNNSPLFANIATSFPGLNVENTYKAYRESLMDKHSEGKLTYLESERLIKEAYAAGVEIFVYQCKMDMSGITFGGPLPFLLE